MSVTRKKFEELQKFAVENPHTPVAEVFLLLDNLDWDKEKNKEKKEEDLILNEEVCESLLQKKTILPISIRAEILSIVADIKDSKSNDVPNKRSRIINLITNPKPKFELKESSVRPLISKEDKLLTKDISDLKNKHCFDLFKTITEQIKTITREDLTDQNLETILIHIYNINYEQQTDLTPHNIKIYLPLIKEKIKQFQNTKNGHASYIEDTNFLRKMNTQFNIFLIIISLDEELSADKTPSQTLAKCEKIIKDMEKIKLDELEEIETRKFENFIKSYKEKVAQMYSAAIANEILNDEKVKPKTKVDREKEIMRKTLIEKLRDLHNRGDQREKLVSLYQVYEEFKYLDLKNEESVNNFKKTIKKNLPNVAGFSSRFGHFFSWIRQSIFHQDGYGYENSTINATTLLLHKLNDFVETHSSFPVKMKIEEERKDEHKHGPS